MTFFSNAHSLLGIKIRGCDGGPKDLALVSMCISDQKCSSDRARAEGVEGKKYLALQIISVVYQLSRLVKQNRSESFGLISLTSTATVTLIHNYHNPPLGLADRDGDRDGFVGMSSSAAFVFLTALVV